VQDISSMKETFQELKLARDAAEEATKAKSMFLSTMSHEIRTPLNAVIGFTELLLLEEPKPSQLESLETLRYSANHLLSLINDILDFNKIDSGKIEFENVEFDLDDVLTSITKLFSLKVEEKKINFIVKAPQKLNNCLVGDITRFNQILHNLISNAIKFTSEGGGVTISYNILMETDKLIRLKLNIQDTGIGISEEGKLKLFKTFSQTHSSTTRLFGGTGLGLAICKKLVELQGGHIGVDSEKGKGSDFYFDLTFKKGIKVADKKQQKTSLPSDENRDLLGASILVVDDNPINIMVAKKFIQRWGGEVTSCVNGQEAIDQVVSNHYDIVLMDLQMPVLGGFEATSIIRKMDNPQHNSIPIIALTASVELSLQEEVMAKGFTAYVTKPFNPTELYRVLSQLGKRNQ
jgi:CheY-like chemotaxis protein/nitrogen-specific signal transduction histidine kinase